jgi:ABC-type lipoprotein release transport system permease subunit
VGRLPLIGRLIGRDLRRRPGQAGLLLLAVTAATSVLALGLVLHGVTSQPFQQTQAATRGPDVVAQLFPLQPAQGAVGPGQSGSGPGRPPAPSAAEVAQDEKSLVAEARTLEHEPGVTAYSGPYLTASGILHARGLTAGVQAEGRDPQASPVDQPVVTAGRWVSNGGVVLERTFADALGVGVGGHVTIDGRSYLIVGIAVTATSSPFPNLCYADCVWNGGPDPASVHISQRDIGLAWVTESAAAAMTAYGKQPPTYLVNLKLKDPGQAQAFASSYQSGNSAPVAVSLTPWQVIASADGLLVLDEQQVLSPGALLAALLALASVVVLAGGRMAQQIRRIGLLKAVGAAPGLVAVVLMAENLVLALLAAAAGLTVGWLAAPLVTSPGAGLLGTPGAPSMTLPIIGEVVAVALVVAVAATLVPAIRAARTSTVDALADSARRPRRGAGLIAISARLPVPLLLGLRLIARRPRRALLTAASVAITVTGIVAVLSFHATADRMISGAASGIGNPVVSRDEQMLMVLTVVLVALATLNAICSTWTTMLDNRHAAALSRALGASPAQVSAGLTAALVIPALPGAVIGVPLGIGLFNVANHGGVTNVPPVWWLVAAVLVTLFVLGLLSAIPARFGTRRPAAEALQAESA